MYNEKDELNIYAPDSSNEFGCETLKIDTSKNSDKFFFIVKRGICTYSKKAYVAQQSGASGVIVIHDKPNQSVKDIIPCSDSLYKNVNIPILLIRKEEGENLLREVRRN